MRNFSSFFFTLPSVVAGIIGTNNKASSSLLPASSYDGFRLVASSTMLFKVTRTTHFTVSFLVGDSKAAGYPGKIYAASIARDTNGNIVANISTLLSSISHALKYRVNNDNTIDVVLFRTEYSPVVGIFILSGNSYVTNLNTDMSDSEIDDTFVDFNVL